MIFDIEEQTAEIKHPNLPDISVTIRKPDELEKVKHFTDMGQYSIPVAVMNPITTLPIYEDVTKGDVVESVMKTKDLPSFPVSILATFISNNIVSFKGFEDKNKKAITWKPEYIKLIFSSKLNVKQEGSKEEPFWSFLNQKILDDRTFDPDPLDLPSPSPLIVQ